MIVTVNRLAGLGGASSQDRGVGWTVRPLRAAVGGLLVLAALGMAGCGGSSTEAQSNPSAVASATVPPLPEPIAFSDRTFWVGGQRVLFQIDLKSAKVTRDQTGGKWKLAIDGTAKNYGASDSAPEFQPMLTYGAESTAMQYDKSITVPGGDTTNFTLVATVKSTFKAKDAVLTQGGASSNQSIVPLDSEKPVKSTKPIEGFADGKSADNGAGLQVKITKSILWPDYNDGNKGNWFAEFQYDSIFNGAKSSDYVQVQTSLKMPDGTSTVGESSKMFANTGSSVLQNGKQNTTAERYSVKGTATGDYTVTFKLTAGASYQTATAPAITFTVS